MVYLIKEMKTRIFKRLSCLFMVISLTCSFLCPSFVYANENSEQESEQESIVNPTTFPMNDYAEVMTSVTSTIEAWRAMGLTDETINGLLSLPVKDADFYDGIPEDENDINPLSDEINTQMLPSSADAEQISRIQYIANVTKNWLGNKEVTMSEYNRYLAYFYVSHYIDNPLYPDLQTRYPWILVPEDIEAYDLYLSRGSAIHAARSLSQLITGIHSLGSNMSNYEEYAAKGYDATAAAYNMSTVTTDLPKFKKGVNAVAEAYIAGYDSAESMSQLFKNLDSSEAIYAFDEYSQFRAVAKAFVTSFCAPLTPYTSLISGVGGFFNQYGGFFDMANKGSLDYSHSTRFALRYYYYLTHYY